MSDIVVYYDGKGRSIQEYTGVGFKISESGVLTITRSGELVCAYSAHAWEYVENLPPLEEIV